MMFIVGCPSLERSGTSTAKPREVLILYTGNLLAELKPCGCSKEEDQGGIERRMQYLKNTRREHPHILLVDTGDILRSPPAREN